MQLLFALVMATAFFTPALPVRDVGDFGPVLTDIESHLPSGHGFRASDKATWTHEGTHGICSELRRRHGCPAFYVLKDRCVLLKEANTTISTVANLVPGKLRDYTYRLYLVDQRRYWENQPTYIIEEFVCYTNGAVAREKLNLPDRTDTVKFAIKFIVYSTCLAKTGVDEKTKKFIMWNTERITGLYKRANYSDTTLSTLQTSDDKDVVELRVFMRNYYGKDWCKRVLGV